MAKEQSIPVDDLHASIIEFECKRNALADLAFDNNSKSTIIYTCHKYNESGLGNNYRHDANDRLRKKCADFSADWSTMRGYIRTCPYTYRTDLKLVEEHLLRTANQKISNEYITAVNACSDNIRQKRPSWW